MRFVLASKFSLRDYWVTKDIGRKFMILLKIVAVTCNTAIPNFSESSVTGLEIKLFNEE